MIDPELPEEPEVDMEEDAGDQFQPIVIETPQRSPAERAFDLFDAGKLGEAGLLAAIGVSREGYVPTEAITHRALDAVEQGRLSEAGLTRVLGG